MTASVKKPFFHVNLRNLQPQKNCTYFECVDYVLSHTFQVILLVTVNLVQDNLMLQECIYRLHLTLAFGKKIVWGPIICQIFQD